jgi:hypothetical protein
MGRSGTLGGRPGAVKASSLASGLRKPGAASARGACARAGPEPGVRRRPRYCEPVPFMRVLCCSVFMLSPDMFECTISARLVCQFQAGSFSPW